MNTVLHLENISKSFGYLKAVENLSFEIKKGNIYGLLGPNGSGKSTTLGMVLNVVNKSAGNYSWFGGDTDPHEALKKVGAIIEHPNFYPYMSAYQNLKLVCRIKGVSYAAIEKVLDTVGLLDRKNSLFSNFSLGMKQRLAIASALLNDPEVLILDEPTNGLDPQGIHQIREIIKSIAKKGTTILLASHLLDEVEKVCTHVVILRKGKKLYSGRVDEMISSHGFFEMKSNQMKGLLKFLDTQPNIAHYKEENGLVTAFLSEPLESEIFVKSLFDNKIILTHFIKRKQSLEEQFLQLTDNK
ncbi:MAG: ABC transporter ATP-binding protein [Flavobacteriaceae bacterium]|jgi:ABC-2 type transport system ATP-binding protein|nr:ABC transporter ATP-binding protein [Flavobacteriaceae bacterium]|tara:strand:- start:2248 stop:3144 length:897 start_codon:yes stop_codon:yes gene_type:complete